MPSDRYSEMLDSTEWYPGDPSELEDEIAREVRKRVEETETGSFQVLRAA